MTRETAAINAGRNGNAAAGRPVLPEGPYWDLDLLTPDDVCALLKVKKSWLYDAVENGALEAIRLGKQLRFRPSALTRYLDERASNGNAGSVNLKLQSLSRGTARGTGLYFQLHARACGEAHPAASENGWKMSSRLSASLVSFSSRMVW